MPTLVIVGAQWGDEAKGKIVDVLADGADVVVRYSGGNNAGHTVITGGQTFKFHLIPAGILHPQVTAVLGSGMVVCPKSLLDEWETARAMRSELGALRISSGAHVLFPYHKSLDVLEEAARGHNKIGTTSRGIGPAFQDKVGRFGIRMGEFVDPEVFPVRLEEVLEYKNRLLSMLGGEAIEFKPLLDEYSSYASALRGFVGDSESFVADALDAGKRIMFEGAQGTFLDLDSGTYPFVTSSHPVAGGACLGTGIGPRAIDQVLGVCKAYTTRVGAGPFPTELDNEIGDKIRERGQEFGTTTGRGRRCGWLDLNLLRRSASLNSLSGWVVTRLDVLSGFERLHVCTGYRWNGRTLNTVPQDTFLLSQVEPDYKTVPGWDADITGARSLADLPTAARDYLNLIEEETRTPICIVSVGPDRQQTILHREDLIWP
ncbi:MAG: adenylosuccinate synthase [Fimbriimonadaceae bacterium]|nr:MAG: adenylosuccinate synthase [Fimbriimonadaceae bacterium]